MDLITLLWVGLMAGVGFYLGFNSLLKGELTVGNPLRWRWRSGERASLSFYFLTTVFILCSAALLGFWFYKNLF